MRQTCIPWATGWGLYSKKSPDPTMHCGYPGTKIRIAISRGMLSFSLYKLTRPVGASFLFNEIAACRQRPDGHGYGVASFAGIYLLSLDHLAGKIGYGKYCQPIVGPRETDTDLIPRRVGENLKL
jgi:hypothetical protein